MADLHRAFHVEFDDPRRPGQFRSSPRVPVDPGAAGQLRGVAPFPVREEQAARGVEIQVPNFM
ncbi:hypothetical protein GCM10027612_57750 [Microbispora bryophytorum subsp. camponoti]